MNGEAYPKQIVNYRLLTEIDAGGSGIVYLAEHLILTERRVAIKLLHTHLTASEDRDRFLDEAKVLYKLQHPHILPLHDVGFHEQRPYLITDYADGGSLRDRLEQPLPWSQVLSILQQIGEALQYAHDQGIVHRDLKPENILFRADGHAYLADFGIAQEVSKQRDTEVVGSVDYMAPEQFKRIICKEIDQYALGCIAYEFLRGHVPFQAATLQELLHLHATEMPPSLIAVKPSLPPAIEQAIFRALAKDPGARFASVHEFLQTLALVPAQHLSLMTSPLAHSHEKTTREWVQEGERQLSAQHPKKALDAFTQALTLDADNLAAWIGKGKAHYQLQHTKKAAEAFEHVLSGEPHQCEALLYKGHLLAQQRSSKKALECYDEVLRFDPQNADVHMVRGKQLYALNRFQEALQAYERASALKKEIVTTDYLASLGDVYFSLENYSDALQAYDKALVGSPKSFAYRWKKAKTLLVLEKYKDALALYEKLLKTPSLSGIQKDECLSGKAKAQFELEKYAEAYTTITKCRTMGQDWSFFFLKGLICFELEKYQEAYNNFTRVLDFKKKHQESLYNIAVVFFNVKQYEDCLKAAIRLLSFHEQYADGWYIKGETLKQLQHYPEALDAYNQAIELRSYDPKAIVGKARCLADLHRYEEALEAYERSLVLDPHRADLLREKGNIYLQEKRLLEAFTTYIKAFHLQQEKTIQTQLLNVIRQMDAPTAEKVLSTLENLIKKYPRLSSFYTHKAQALLQLQRYEDALETAEIALAADDKDADALSIKSLAQRMINLRRSFSESSSPQAKPPMSASVQPANVSSASPHLSLPPAPLSQENPQSSGAPLAASSPLSSHAPPSLPDEQTTSAALSEAPQATPSVHPASSQATPAASLPPQEKGSWWNRLMKKFGQ
ncbi:hypothetical protein KSF_108600 [Reticulibacter mediterranei]|uniref:Protein kinase domain-containing protein n=1 Tax=Reticulibacter mediterranei TaxID=2778369 RepID=A0A8J3J1U8_9CHLR|nr:serine/threonine-protein kinase [Reticulibacter mediterranei]GHP00813.1 hypothetical protein KSF_108600 [Reticulibacter mediterranei]